LRSSEFSERRRWISCVHLHSPETTGKVGKNTEKQVIGIHFNIRGWVPEPATTVPDASTELLPATPGTVNEILVGSDGTLYEGMFCFRFACIYIVSIKYGH
jgi:hypothetical protein